MLRVWEEDIPYSNAFSFSSFVAVTLLTGGEAALGADTTSCKYEKHNYYLVKAMKSQADETFNLNQLGAGA